MHVCVCFVVVGAGWGANHYEFKNTNRCQVLHKLFVRTQNDALSIPFVEVNYRTMLVKHCGVYECVLLCDVNYCVVYLISTLPHFCSMLY